MPQPNKNVEVTDNREREVICRKLQFLAVALGGGLLELDANACAGLQYILEDIANTVFPEERE